MRILQVRGRAGGDLAAVVTDVQRRIEDGPVRAVHQLGSSPDAAEVLSAAGRVGHVVSVLVASTGSRRRGVHHCRGVSVALLDDLGGVDGRASGHVVTEVAHTASLVEGQRLGTGRVHEQVTTEALQNAGTIRRVSIEAVRARGTELVAAVEQARRVESLLSDLALR